MDSSALQAILAVSQAAAIDGGALALVNPQRAVSTVLNLTQADQLLAVYASMAEAPARLSGQVPVPAESSGCRLTWRRVPGLPAGVHVTAGYGARSRRHRPGRACALAGAG